MQQITFVGQHSIFQEFNNYMKTIGYIFINIYFSKSHLIIIIIKTVIYYSIGTYL